MEQQSSTKKYLKECYRMVVVPALNDGLDSECYHLYLSQIYCSLLGDSGVRRTFREMMRDCERDIFARISNGDSAWQAQYGTFFKKQRHFMENLLEYIDKNVTDDDTKALARAQLSFMRLQLHAQKRHLDTISFYAPSKELWAAQGIYGDFIDALDAHGKLLKRVMSHVKSLEED